jgi:hypothetical protein
VREEERERTGGEGRGSCASSLSSRSSAGVAGRAGTSSRTSSVATAGDRRRPRRFSKQAPAFPFSCS